MEHDISSLVVVFAGGIMVCCVIFYSIVGIALGTHEDERTVLYKTKSLDGTKPNTLRKTSPKTNPNPNTNPNANLN